MPLRASNEYVSDMESGGGPSGWKSDRLRTDQDTEGARKAFAALNNAEFKMRTPPLDCVKACDSSRMVSIRWIDASRQGSQAPTHLVDDILAALHVVPTGKTRVK